jgi:hypothetical protein
VIALADAARLRFVRLLGPLARPLLVSRDVRIGWTGALLVASAFVATGLLPLWVLALGPIVWGVPHVLSDVRYLVVRRGYHRRASIAVPAMLGVACGWAGLGVRGALAFGGIAALFAAGTKARRVVVCAAMLALAAAAQASPVVATIVFAHVHNLVALGFFVLWPSLAKARPGAAPRLAPAAIAAIGSIAIMGGALDGAVARATPLGSATFDAIVEQLAPAWLVEDPRLAARLTLLYAFGQGVHYVVWLRLVPEADRPSPRPRSFRQSLRALRADLGAPLLVAGALAALVFAAWAMHDLATARVRYLQVAFFHGWIEIVAAAVMIAERPTSR